MLFYKNYSNCSDWEHQCLNSSNVLQKLQVSGSANCQSITKDTKCHENIQSSAVNNRHTHTQSSQNWKDDGVEISITNNDPTKSDTAILKDSANAWDVNNKRDSHDSTEVADAAHSGTANIENSMDIENDDESGKVEEIEDFVCKKKGIVIAGDSCNTSTANSMTGNDLRTGETHNRNDSSGTHAGERYVPQERSFQSTSEKLFSDNGDQFLNSKVITNVRDGSVNREVTVKFLVSDPKTQQLNKGSPNCHEEVCESHGRSRTLIELGNCPFGIRREASAQDVTLKSKSSQGEYVFSSRPKGLQVECDISH